MFDDFQTKRSVVVVYTGEGKGKTSASLGLVARALGNDWRVSFVQFIKHWQVGEHKFLTEISSLYSERLDFYKGGKGFFNAGDLSAKGVSEEQHRQAAIKTYEHALSVSQSGRYELVVCDEINNAVNDGLITPQHLIELIEKRHESTSLCLTGRNFPMNLKSQVDILTNMTKIRHHFDDKFLANKGIDY